MLHGGPGAQGEMQPVCETVSSEFGVLEFYQTQDNIQGQIRELHTQLTCTIKSPVILVGYSWGAWLAYLFTARYPEWVKKLILISAAPFEESFVKDLLPVRLQRLDVIHRKETEFLLKRIHSQKAANADLLRFGELMSMADSYDPDKTKIPVVSLDIQIFRKVWKEASLLRKTGELINQASSIKCPVTAIHGVYDPHPVAGVEECLSKKITGFKMIRLTKCGHCPWVEKQAGKLFYEILIKEIREP
ncbi:MAG: alpha/beta hydrolase [Candidatus Azobacteroides sp.]|nr:alpha/beta hydrolase [Candidatus Azobacteroides sp.]